MKTRAKRTTAEVDHSKFGDDAASDLGRARYVKAHKGATTEIDEVWRGPNRGKDGFGMRAILEKWNERELSSPNDKKLKKTAIVNILQRGEIGITPPKIGRPKTIPLCLTETLAQHAVMMQLAGQGEATWPKMQATVKALTFNTEWDHMKPNVVWRQTRSQHTAIINPSSLGQRLSQPRHHWNSCHPGYAS